MENYFFTFQATPGIQKICVPHSRNEKPNTEQLQETSAINPKFMTKYLCWTIANTWTMLDNVNTHVPMITHVVLIGDIYCSMWYFNRLPIHTGTHNVGSLKTLRRQFKVYIYQAVTLAMLHCYTRPSIEGDPLQILSFDCRNNILTTL